MKKLRLKQRVGAVFKSYRRSIIMCFAVCLNALFLNIYDVYYGSTLWRAVNDLTIGGDSNIAVPRATLWGLLGMAMICAIYESLKREGKGLNPLL